MHELKKSRVLDLPSMTPHHVPGSAASEQVAQLVLPLSLTSEQRPARAKRCMERLYVVQDEAQDWLVLPVHQPDNWPRYGSLHQRTLTRSLSQKCLMVARWINCVLLALWPSLRQGVREIMLHLCWPHSDTSNLALSYPIFVSSFNFAESRVTLETPHCTPIRFLQWAPLSTGRLLLSADDTTICIWQFGVRMDAPVLF